MAHDDFISENNIHPAESADKSAVPGQTPGSAVSVKGSRRSVLSIIGTALRVFFIVITGIVIGVNIYMLNASRFGGNKLPMPFGYGGAVVLSGSMSPALEVGDLVIIKKVETASAEPVDGKSGRAVSSSELKCGDIIVFEDGSSLVIHRLVNISNASDFESAEINEAGSGSLPDDSDNGSIDTLIFTTKGDANNTEDKPIPADAVKGILIMRIPGAGDLILRLRSPVVIAVLIAIVIALTELSIYIDKKRGSDDTDELKREIEKLKKEIESPDETDGNND